MPIQAIKTTQFNEWLASLRDSEATHMKRQEFTPFDSADYLNSETDIAAYLEAVAEENDPRLTMKALGDVVRARNMMARAAESAGITRAGLYKAFSPEGNPSFVTVFKVARDMGLRLVFKADPDTKAIHRTGAAGKEPPRTTTARKKKAR